MATSQLAISSPTPSATFRHDLGGGASADGTVFEIAKTAGGYASTPTTLVSFNGADGANPSAA